VRRRAAGLPSSLRHPHACPLYTEADPCTPLIHDSSSASPGCSVLSSGTWTPCSRTVLPACAHPLSNARLGPQPLHQRTHRCCRGVCRHGAQRAAVCASSAWRRCSGRRSLATRSRARCRRPSSSRRRGPAERRWTPASPASCRRLRATSSGCASCQTLARCAAACSPAAAGCSACERMCTNAAQPASPGVTAYQQQATAGLAEPGSGDWRGEQQDAGRHMQPPAADVAVWQHFQRRLWMLKNWMMGPQHTATGGRRRHSCRVLRHAGRTAVSAGASQQLRPWFCACF
jgi:hypothetical protein